MRLDFHLVDTFCVEINVLQEWEHYDAHYEKQLKENWGPDHSIEYTNSNFNKFVLIIAFVDLKMYNLFRRDPTYNPEVGGKMFWCRTCKKGLADFGAIER